RSGWRGGGWITSRPAASSRRIASRVSTMGRSVAEPRRCYTAARGVIMRYEHILLSTHAGLGTVTMNRPERRNALSEAHMRELIDAFRGLGRDEDVRAIILAANGPVFCSGHHLPALAEADLDAMRTLLTVCTELMRTMQRVPQPVVARVHGLATAAGCQLVASADLAVAAEEAAFAAPGGRGGWFCHTPMVAIARSLGR